MASNTASHTPVAATETLGEMKMMRFFAMAKDPLNGSYLHLVFTSHKPTAKKCLEELESRFNAGVLSMKPLFFDRGTCDNDLHSIEKVYGFKLVEKVAA